MKHYSKTVASINGTLRPSKFRISVTHEDSHEKSPLLFLGSSAVMLQACSTLDSYQMAPNASSVRQGRSDLPDVLSFKWSPITLCIVVAVQLLSFAVTLCVKPALHLGKY